MHVLVTGSSGLIGSEAGTFVDKLGFKVTGVDNNMRADFFGPKGDTTWNRQRLES
jgi:CDP-paratose 2-epimerase